MRRCRTKRIRTSSRKNDHEPRDVGKQAHEDVERGVVDTDRRGGDDYQRDTQRDEHANINSGKTGRC